MMTDKQERIEYLEDYLNKKARDIVETEKKLKAYIREKKKALNVKSNLEHSLKYIELQEAENTDMSEESKNINELMEECNIEILRLTAEIYHITDLLDDLEVDYDMTTEELQKIKNN